MPSKGSVLVAMSGGVDSSVAACLLADQGYEVFGSHMNLVHLDGVEHGCCGPSARADAEAVARVAGFPFEIADHSEEFAETVIAGFVEEHAAGRTPNPCATCNGQIKFGAFLRRADQLGMDFVATGHYVRASQNDDGRWHLLRGADASKDQTYMLHMLGQAQLARSLFPVGGLPKAETRRLAEAFGLPVAGKPDSQELCFAPSGDAGGFVRSTAPALVRERWRGGRSRRSACSANTTGRSRSRSVSAEGSASRSANPRTCSTSTPPRTASWWDHRCCWHDGAWSPTARRGSRAGRPPTGRSRPRCGSATRARMRRRSSSHRRRVPRGVP